MVSTLEDRPPLWWQRGAVYQIYPRSFMDSNADGVGDLKGIAAKLDYLAWLGVDAIWLSPIFPSPMADFGYDVSNYTGIEPVFGTLADFDDLLEETHRRGLKLLLDLVPNHTSDEHEWFRQSRLSRDNPRRDWYIWRDPTPGGGPPNNWESNFGGPAWEWDAPTGQYYLHLFHTKQPDLNWRNPQVRQAIYGAMRFWLDRGVDGFRIDVLNMLIKDEQLRDNPFNADWQPGDPPWMRQHKLYSDDQPEMQEIVQEMRQLVEQYGAGQRVLIGEIYLPLPRLMRYYGQELNGVHLPFNFQLIELEHWSARSLREIIKAYEAVLPPGAWPNWVLGNHDKSRIVSRIGSAQARVAQMLLLTLRGTPTLYYGDELGMHDVPIPPELAHDPQEMGSPGFGRDPERTPMQWDASPNAGFCPPAVTPWLPLAEDHEEINIAREESDPFSMLTLVRSLLELRRSSLALEIGRYQAVENDGLSQDCLVYLRVAGVERYLVALNFSAEEQILALSEPGPAQVIISTLLDRTGTAELSALKLRPAEGCLIKLS